MGYIKGRNVRVEVAATFATAKSVTAITNAATGVATSSAHGLADGVAGYLSGVTSMPQLEGQAVRINAPATNTFELETLDTTSMGTFSGTCNFVPVATWLTLAPSTSINIGGGDADQLSTTVLLDNIKQQENGMLASQTISIDLRAEDAQSAAMRQIRNAALAGGFVLLRVTYPNGSKRLARGEPSLPGEQVQTSQVGTSSVNLTVKGQVLFLD